MRPADMPAGLSNLLHLTANNMQIADTEVENETKERIEKKGGDDERS
jgi:hypothetical protein